MIPSRAENSSGVGGTGIWCWREHLFNFRRTALLQHLGLVGHIVYILASSRPRAPVRCDRLPHLMLPKVSRQVDRPLVDSLEGSCPVLNGLQRYIASRPRRRVDACLLWIGYVRI